MGQVQQQMEVIFHEAGTVQLERLPLFRKWPQRASGRQGDHPGIQKPGLAVIATINDVVDQTVGNGSQRARHGDSLPRLLELYQVKRF